MNSSIFLVEDNQTLLPLLEMMIDKIAGVDLCGSAENAEQALEKLETVKADIAIVDGSLPGMNGKELIKHLKVNLPDLRCLFHSGRNEFETVKNALNAGACGYVVKGGARQELEDAISTTIEGGCYLSPTVVNREELLTD